MSTNTNGPIRVVQVPVHFFLAYTIAQTKGRDLCPGRTELLEQMLESAIENGPGHLRCFQQERSMLLLDWGV